MYAIDFNLDAYQRLSEFEMLLRRIIRWELMSSKGRGWLASTDKNFVEIESRIEREKKSGLYSESSSDLSYLSLHELLNLIFIEFWKNKFDKILKHDKGIYYLALKNIVPLRNKVAHFRYIDILDQQNYQFIIEIENILRQHYSKDCLIDFYLSSDPAWVAESIDTENINQIKFLLEQKEVGGLWDDYSRFDGVRAHNIYPGLGMFYDNIFIELFVDSLSPDLDLISWINKNKFTVSIVSTTESKIRFFWPLSVGNSEIRKGFNGLARMISHCSRQKNSNFTIRPENSEYIARLRPDKNICIAF